MTKYQTSPTTQSNSKDIVTLEDLMNLEVRRIESQIQALDSLTEAKFVTYKTLVDAQSAQVALALSASEKAITKAEGATEKRFEGINEFRNSLADLSNLMATRRELESSIAEIKTLLSEHSKQLAELRSKIDVGPAGLSALQNQYAVMQGAKVQIADNRNLIFALIAAAVGILGFIIGR